MNRRASMTFDLRPYVAEVVEKAAELLARLIMGDGGCLMTQKLACEYLDCSPETLKRLGTEVIYIDSKPRYRKRDLDKAVGKKSHGGPDAI